MITRLDHVAIAVRSLDEALPFYTERLGLRLDRIEVVPEQGVRVAFLPLGESEIELLEPLDPTNSIGRFIEKRGEGLHHICLATGDIQQELSDLAAAGTAMIDQTARPGGGGALVGFLHPKAANGVLVELSQRKE
ncbi:MAG: methylmalonyl-CoA epimerase [Chloroflexi bacterium]|nr:methylmalonyl-CoA epimerase [Chloroflexota bacterium]